MGGILVRDSRTGFSCGIEVRDSGAIFPYEGLVQYLRTRHTRDHSENSLDEHVTSKVLLI